jgi:micrococcal nuclease
MRIIVALLALVSATGVFAQQSPPKDGWTVVVQQSPKIIVRDAKNVIVDDVRWRLKGYSAPLIEDAKCGDERVRGIRARDRLEEMIASARIEVAVFPEGRWDRWLRLARLTIDGNDVGPVLIAESLAVKAGQTERWGCPEPAKKPVAKPAPKPAVVKEKTIVKEKTVVIKEKTVVVVIKEKPAKRKCVWVGGYTRSDGTQVKGYQRCTNA